MCAHLRPKSRRNAAVGLRNASLRLGVRDRTARPPECLGCVTAFRTRGRIPCAAMRLSLHEKRRDRFRHAFAYLTVLRPPRQRAGFYVASSFSQPNLFASFHGNILCARSIIIICPLSAISPRSSGSPLVTNTMSFRVSYAHFGGKHGKNKRKFIGFLHDSSLWSIDCHETTVSII